MKIVTLFLAAALLASCNNSADPDDDLQDTTTVTDPGMGSGETMPMPDSTQNGLNDTSTYEGAANDSLGR